MNIQFWAATDTGRTREHNEDNFLVDKKLKLFIVADGMGGHAAGEVASSVAVHEVRKAIADQKEIVDRFVMGGSLIGKQSVLTLIKNAIVLACQQVHRLAQENAERQGMGTTLSLLLVGADRGFIGHVGDSRIYRSRNGVVSQLTEDHSVINELIKSGRLKPGDAFDSPYKNAVTRAVGVHPTVEVDAIDFEIKEGDHFLLCSDGLSCYLTDELTADILEKKELKEIPQAFINHANQSGGKDNITAIVVKAVKDEVTKSTEEAQIQAQAQASPTLVSQAKTPPPQPSTLSQSPIKTPKNEIIEIAPSFAFEARLSQAQAPIDVLKLSSLFKYVDQVDLEQIIHFADILAIAPNTILFQEGYVNDELIVVLKGQLQLSSAGKKVGEINVGQSFGEDRLIAKTPNDVTVISSTQSIVFKLSRAQFFVLMAQSPLLGLQITWALSQNAHFKVLKLYDDLKITQQILEQNQLGSIIEGNKLSTHLHTPSSLIISVNEEVVPKFLVDRESSTAPSFEIDLKHLKEDGVELGETEFSKQNTLAEKPEI
jgi:serine/threonine protein phosphatase PrpC